MMSLNKITINRNTSGLGAPLISKDHVSGLLFYSATLPSGFGANDRIKKFLSLQDAETAGILETGDFAVEWYHIREYFEKNPKGEVFVGIYTIPGTPVTHDFAEVETMQVFADGEMRQIGVYYPHVAFNGNETALVGALQAIATTVKNNNIPLNILFGGDVSGLADLTTLLDLTTLTANNVSVTIGQDLGGKGNALFIAESVSITDLGAKLGTISKAAVNESIAWVEAFPMVTDGTEFDKIAFANGDTYKSISYTSREAIDNLGYLFLLKHEGLANTYNNDSYCAVSSTNDLFSIERNRTIDKAARDVRKNLLPSLGAPLYVNAEGEIAYATVAKFKALAEKPLSEMEANGEVSAYKVLIDPSQNVVTSSSLTISLEIVPVGVARSIIVNIGFTLNIA